MIHPSYLELMNSVNQEEGENYEKVMSRYSIVIAAAKRARQLTDGASPRVPVSAGINKVLSTAVEELYTGKIHLIHPETDAAEEIADEAACAVSEEEAVQEAEE